MGVRGRVMNGVFVWGGVKGESRSGSTTRCEGRTQRVAGRVGVWLQRLGWVQYHRVGRRRDVKSDLKTNVHTGYEPSQKKSDVFGRFFGDTPDRNRHHTVGYTFSYSFGRVLHGRPCWKLRTDVASEAKRGPSPRPSPLRRYPTTGPVQRRGTSARGGSLDRGRGGMDSERVCNGGRRSAALLAAGPDHYFRRGRPIQLSLGDGVVRPSVELL